MSSKYKVGDKFKRDGGEIELLRITRTKKNARAEFRCYCGNIFQAQIGHIANHGQESCGCYREKNVKKHGLGSHPLYKVWLNIYRLVNNPSHKHYKDYGGRGIKLYKEWEEPNNFIKYIEENLGDKPSADYSIDRINNNGNYEPGNLRWATSKEQARNTRGNKKTLDYNTIIEACEEYNMPYDVVKKRITAYGWDQERALTTPVRVYRRKNKLRDK